MPCSECNKNLATVHMTKVENGQISKVHLCEECAGHQGGSEMSGVIDLSDVLASIPQMIALLVDAGEMEEFSSDAPLPRCEACGSSLDDLRETGRVGCPQCYESFAPRLAPLLERIHGRTEHMGKIPARAGAHIVRSHRLRELRRDLGERIATEEFEEAARIRDEIKALERGLDPSMQEEFGFSEVLPDDSVSESSLGDNVSRLRRRRQGPGPHGWWSSQDG